jgi:hypothetical protein
MRKIEIHTYLLALLITLILSGCGGGPAIPEDGISEQEAIDAALNIAAMSHPEISGSQVTPSNIHAEQMSLGKAVKRINENNNVAAGYTPDGMVWLVTMDGIWLDEFPRLTDMPTPVPYRHFLIILDAKSGLEIETAARP